MNVTVSKCTCTSLFHPCCSNRECNISSYLPGVQRVFSQLHGVVFSDSGLHFFLSFPPHPAHLSGPVHATIKSIRALKGNVNLVFLFLKWSGDLSTHMRQYTQSSRGFSIFSFCIGHAQKFTGTFFILTKSIS